MVDYQSLYRRYRPQRFSEVRGQDHVVGALRHAVRDTVVHAYLFSGPRGTGKTSTARILAKALNCTSPVEGEPCGVCESCLDITRGASFDVHELDAASNNGVDAMRDLVARASLATPGRWKVYIVDEVHMLSASASNALLKTLEEPPDHVVFVLATTDPQKVLPTIRSRTQHYEFHLLDAEVLGSLLADVAKDADLDLPVTVVEAAVRRGRGSARDALSALDQVVASGVVDDDTPYLQELLVALAERDTARALKAIETALVAGRDAPRIASGLLDELRNQFLTALAPEATRGDEAPDGAISRAPAEGAPPHAALMLGPARSVRAMEVLGTAMVAMRDALDARITLEVAIVRLTHPEVDDDASALLDRIERLERRVQELAGTGGGAPPVAPPPPPAVPRPSAKVTAAPGPGAQSSAPEPARGESPSSPPALGAFSRGAEPASPNLAPISPPPETQTAASGETNGAPQPGSELPPPTRDELTEAWGDHVLNQLRAVPRAVFAVGRFLATDGDTAVLALPNQAHVERAQANSAEVADALGRHFGRTVRIRLVAEHDAPPPKVVSGPTGARPAKQRGRAEEGLSAQAAGDGRALSQSGPAPRPGPPGEATDEDGDDVLDPDELDPLGDQVPGDALAWAQERLMQVFPGAEEV